MKFLAVLFLALGLALQTGPLCADAAPLAAATSMAMDCSNAQDGHLPVPDGHAKDSATACHACASRAAEPPTVQPGAVWNDPVPKEEAATSIKGIALKPPHPPPRDQAMPNHST